MTDSHTVTLLMTEFVTHDTKRFLVTKPDGFDYDAGQGVEMAINTPRWKDEWRPFTPTSLQRDKVLEFIIKGYPDHDGVTEQLHGLEPGAELLLSDVFGTIKYQGPGVFIAAGAGITPFIAICREQHEQNKIEGSTLLFTNKTPADVMLERELRHYFGDRCLMTCTQDESDNSHFLSDRIDQDFLKKHVDNFDQPFYLCGPLGFMDSISDALKDLGVETNSLVFEE